MLRQMPSFRSLMLSAKLSIHSLDRYNMASIGEKAVFQQWHFQRKGRSTRSVVTSSTRRLMLPKAMASENGSNSKKVITGKCYVCQDNIDTDQIIPAGAERQLFTISFCFMRY